MLSVMLSGMASLRRKLASKFWWACFSLPNGSRVQRSTKEIDRRKAQRIADTYEEATRNRRTARQVREVIADMHERITGEKLPSITLAVFIESWLAGKRVTTAPATLAFYTTAVSKFLAFLGDEKDREISEITREHITRFRNEEAKTLAPKTVNHDLKCLKGVFKAARRDGVLVEDPAEFVEIVRQVGESNRRPFTIPELQAVLGVADEEWRSLVLMGLYTGQRLGDLARVTWAQVDLVRDEIRLGLSAKTDRRIILPLAVPLRRHLESLPAGDDPHAPLHPRAFEIVAREHKTGTVIESPSLVQNE